MKEYELVISEIRNIKHHIKVKFKDEFKILDPNDSVCAYFDETAYFNAAAYKERIEEQQNVIEVQVDKRYDEQTLELDIIDLTKGDDKEKNKDVNAAEAANEGIKPEFSYTDLLMYDCPKCHCGYDILVNGKLERCSECGQKFDWSDYVNE